MKIKIYFDDGLWKLSPNIQYLSGKYLSTLGINKKFVSFYLLLIIKQYRRSNILKRFKKYGKDI